MRDIKLISIKKYVIQFVIMDFYSSQKYVMILTIFNLMDATIVKIVVKFNVWYVKIKNV